MTARAYSPLTALILLLLATFTSAQSNDSQMPSLGDRSGSHAPEGAQVAVEGLVRRVGADPFSHIVITDDDGEDWYVTREDEHLFAGLEQQRVSVRGAVRLRRLVLADGRELGSRRELVEVEILQAPKSRRLHEGK